MNRSSHSWLGLAVMACFLATAPSDDAAARPVPTGAALQAHERADLAHSSPLVRAAAERAVRSGEGAAPTAPRQPIEVVESIISAIALPLAIVIVVLLVTFSGNLQRRFGDLFRQVKHIKAPGGLEIELTSAAVPEVRSEFRKAFGELMAKADDEYGRLVEAKQLRETMKDALSGPDCLARMLRECAGKTLPPDWRATIHVPDIVFSEFLYQLVEYYPFRPGSGRAGRRFSQRYGIIGRAWRLKKSIGEGNALRLANEIRNAEDEERRKAVRDVLIGEWGMMDEEADNTSHAKSSYLCVMLKKTRVRGLLYIDAREENAFGDRAQATQLANTLESCTELRAFVEDLAGIMDDLQNRAPLLSVDMLRR